MARQKIDHQPGYLPPGDRPKCRDCGKALRPFVAHEFRDGELVPVRVAFYGYDGRQWFCGLRCGYAYGCRAARREHTGG